MAQFSVSNVKIAGVAASVPSEKVFNSGFKHINEKDRALLIKTTGINERRVAPSHICASDLCLLPAQKILKKLNWRPEEIDLLVFVSQTPDHLIPGSATQIHQKLGLSNCCMALDINQGCAGYVYGLATISAMMQSGHVSKALLLVGDTITRTLSPEDKSTAPIFSDAGSATALEFKKGVPEMYFNLQSTGNGFDAIMIQDGGARFPFNNTSLVKEEQGPGISRNRLNLGMKGLSIFNFALKEVVPNIRSVLEFSKLAVDEPDYYIFHQANLLLNESLRKKLKLAPEKVPYTLHKFGNTSCATIPVTLASELHGSFNKGSHRIVLSGFGVGLSWGAAVIELSSVVILPLFEWAEDSLR